MASTPIQRHVLVREARLDDLPDIIAVAETSFSREFALTGFDRERAKRIGRRVFSRRARIFLGILRLLGKVPFRFLVAEAERRVVGTTMVYVEGTHTYLANVAVDPSFRRRGLARSMLERALTFTRERKLNKAILHVLSDNTAAKSLYESMGFEPFEKIIWAFTELQNLPQPDDPAELTVRKYSRTDADDLYQLISHATPPATKNVLTLRKSDLQAPMLMRILRVSDTVRWVAEKDRQIAGTITLSKGAMNVVTLSELYTSTNESEEPIQRALLHTALKGAKGIGATRFLVRFNAEKQNLLKMLEAIGRTETLLLDGMVRRL